MYVFAQGLGIKISVKDLQSKKPGLLGKANAKTKEIELDISLLDDTRKHKCVLAEEIGHILYPPRQGHTAYHSRNFFNYDNRGNIEAIVAQDERKALDWATNVLISDVEFYRVIKNNVTLFQLTEYFDVDEWFMRHKIAYVRRKARNEGTKLKWRDIIRRM